MALVRGAHRKLAQRYPITCYPPTHGVARARFIPRAVPLLAYFITHRPIWVTAYGLVLRPVRNVGTVIPHVARGRWKILGSDPIRIGAPAVCWAHLRDRGAVQGIVCPKVHGEAPALPLA